VIIKRLEFGFGSVWGYYKPLPDSREFTYSTPLLEMKYLFSEFQPTKQPGITLAIGTALSAVKGEFVPPGKGLLPKSI
jgi:hypothetical protein